MHDIFRRNLGYKIVSLVLAISFWLWITNQQEPTGLFGERSFDVQLVLNNQPPNLVVVSNLPTISVRLDNDNQGINVKELYAYVDLKDAMAGEHSFEVFMDVPEGIEIKAISPKNIVLRLDTVKDKIVPVMVNVTGTPGDGFVAGQPIIMPPVVNVRGPTAILEKLENVVVKADITGKVESMRIARAVTYEDTEGKGIFTSDPNQQSLNAFPETVEVVIPIYPKGTASKTVPLTVSTSGKPADGMTVRMITPLPSQVLLLGDEESLKAIQYVKLGTVNVSGLNANKVVDIPLNSVKLPEGVSFNEGTSISVMVYIGPSSVERIIKGIPVGINNIPEGLSAETISSIDLKISGYPDILDALKPGDITAWVDATNLQAGTYSSTAVLWKAPSGVSVLNVPKVTLILNETKPPDSEGDNNEPDNENAGGSTDPGKKTDGE